GVYRYDQLIVLRQTHMPAVLLEAGSIVNRDEELQLSSPERQDLTAAAATEAVEAFCTARATHKPMLMAKTQAGPKAFAGAKAPVRAKLMAKLADRHGAKGQHPR